MKDKNIIKGPILPTPSGLVYSITILSGNIVTSPAGFGIDIESVVPAESIDSTHHLEDYEPSASKEQVHDALRRVATAKKS